MQLSPQQESIIAAIAANDHDVQVTARAGCGKTTTILEGCAAASGRVAFFAFNKEIANELSRKAPPGVKVQTLHALGYAALAKHYGSIQVDGDRVFNILRKHLSQESAYDRELLAPAKKLLSLCKNLLCATDDATLEEVCIAYDIEVTGVKAARVRDVVRKALVDSIPGEGRPVLIDFDDMLYLPVTLDVKMPTYDWTFIDEAQDMNPVQVKLVEKVIEHGRVCYVGDPCQAIYAFRGSDEEAMPNFKAFLEGLGRTVIDYPLTITRRCPKNVVAVANAYVPDIEAAPEAPLGGVFVAEEVAPSIGDMVLCRANAPLVRIAYRLIRQGTPVIIRGRDIGTGLVALIKKLRPSSIHDLRLSLADHEHEERQIMRRRYADRPWKLEAALAALSDKINTIDFICEERESIEDLVSFIDRLFGDEPNSKATVLLSTIHKAKGLESATVWIQEFKPIPGPQENNILYVAITRAKRHLFVVSAVPGTPVRIPIHLAGPPASPLMAVE